MAPVGNPRTWIPYVNNKDCSQGFCSLYCPQWCYIVYPSPPPPPPPFEYPYDDDSSSNFSPLVVAVIGVLATAFLLITYYTIVSKYCTGHRESAPNDHELQQNNNHEQPPWHVVVPTTGLDESLIKSIAVFKYSKKDHGFVVDRKNNDCCSVCLSEFQDGESVRLLPKCNHAFHLPCIDTWLKSHSNCPLCRASITFTSSNNASSSSLQVIEHETTSIENQYAGDDVAGVVGSGNDPIPKPALRAFSDLGNLHRVIEIRDDEVYNNIIGSFTRSVSMDHSFQSGLFSVAHVMHHVNQEEDDDGGPSSKRSRGGESSSKSRSYRRRVLHCVLSSVATKRSFSSGRFSISKIDRGRQGIVPV